LFSAALDAFLDDASRRLAAKNQFGHCSKRNRNDTVTASRERTTLKLQSSDKLSGGCSSATAIWCVYVYVYAARADGGVPARLCGTRALAISTREAYGAERFNEARKRKAA
jgi:hypothetical protein